MKLGSLFDGSGGFPLAGALNGIEPVWSSEVEPYPIAVTRSRFPNTKHYGNVCEINGAEIEPVDIITFGSPCQDMSVAGKRAGLKHSEQGDEETTRSGLFYEAIRIIKEMRAATNGKYPRFAVWENVAGAFSSNKGWDFHAVIEAFCSVCDNTVSIPRPYDAKQPDKLVWSGAGEVVGDNYSFAWRTFDAQYWSVPQRRMRIYAVADFGGGCAGEILFKWHGLRGDLPSSHDAGQGIAADALGGVDGGSGVECLNDQGGSSINVEQTGTAPTLRAQSHQHEPVIALQANGIDRADTAGCNGCGWREDECYTLNTIDRHGVCYALDCRNHIANEELSATLQAKTEGGFSLNFVNPVCYDARGNGDGNTVNTLTGDHQNRITDYTAIACFQNTGRGWWNEGEIAECLRTPSGGDAVKANLVSTYQRVTGPLMANSHPGSYTGQDAFSDILVAGERPKPPRRYIIRRLIPLECSRLQGFPDGWSSLVPYDGDAKFWEQVRKTHAEINGKKYKPVKDIEAWYNKLHTDSAEYKMWGNGIALPNAEYVMRGIVNAISHPAAEKD